MTTLCTNWHDYCPSLSRRAGSAISHVLAVLGIVTLIIVSCPVITEAQTEWKDNYVTLAEGDQTNPSIARPSEGAYTIIVWEDTKDPASWHTDIYAQKIDNQNGFPMWSPPDGVPVCTAGGNQKNPHAAYDSLGNVIVVWEDYRNDSTKASIYANCLLVSDGSISRSWSLNGVAVCNLTAHAERPRIAGGRDGAFIAWVDWRNSHSVVTDSAYRDIYMQYMVSSTGSYAQGGNAVWAYNGVLVPSTNIHDDRNVELARDFYWPTPADSTTNDGAMLVYESKRVISSATSDSIYVVYADRFDANGARTWGDVRLATSNEEQVLPQVVVLGRKHGSGDSTGVIVWQDMRPDPDPPVSYDIYSQHLSKYTGHIMGTASGDAICDMLGIQRYPVLSLYEREEDPGLGISYLARVACAWEDLRNAPTQGVDLFTVVINGVTGALTNPAGTTGEEICTSERDQMQVRVDNYIGDEMAYFVWRDGDDGGTDDDNIWYQNMDLLSCTMYQTVGEGAAVTEAKGDQTDPQVGGDVFAWADKRREPILYDNHNDWNIYAETPGSCVGPTNMDWRDMFADVSTIGDAAAMRFAVDAEYNTFVVWEEPGEEKGSQDVYIQKLDKTGVPRWQNSGINLNANTYASHPDVCISDSTGGAQVVWHEDENGDGDIRYAKLSPLGAITALEQVDVAGEDCHTPYIAYSTKNARDTTGTAKYPAQIAFLLTDGGGNNEIGLKGGNASVFSNIAVGDLDHSLVDLRLAATPHGEVFIVAWENSTPANMVIAWNYPNPTGGACSVYEFVVDEFGGADIAPDFTGGGWNRAGFVAYCADDGSGDMDLFARRIPATTGNISAPYNLTNIAGAARRATQPALAPDSSINASGYGGMLVAWDWENTTSSTHTVQTNQFEYTGTIQWSNSTIIDASEDLSDFSHPDIARLSNMSTAGDTMSFIVYEGISESCSPSRPDEVLGQYVFYNAYGPYARGAQWKSGAWPLGKQIGPGPGNYTQTLPMVRTSENSTVSVYWIDGRGRKDLVLGTRAWCDTVSIYWLKERIDAPPVADATMLMDALYPNPLSLSRSSMSHVVLDASHECTVDLKLYDNLGRVVATVFTGALPAGIHTLRFDASGLRTGMYYYVLRSSDATSTRGLVIVR